MAKMQRNTFNTALVCDTIPKGVYTAECSFSLTASYYAYQCYLGLIRNIGVYLMGYPVHTNIIFGEVVAAYTAAINLTLLLLQVEAL